MQMTGNTILITGGGSGIGRGWAEAFHALGNQVIIAGRRADVLDQVVAANPGMARVVFDVEEAGALPGFVARLVADHPGLNVLINNAGIMRAEDMLAKPYDLTDAEATVVTNLLGPIRLTAALLPQLLAQPAATVLNVSSGLAFVPLAATPTYSATKAALHSWSQSLRYQLRQTSVQVIEVAPPAVGTDLMPGSRGNPHAMALPDYTAETMALLAANPDAPEILVEAVKRLRFAEANQTYGAVFAMINPAGG
ncbi:MAG: SDR family oxidoreductase [Pseudorhodobacter sp.]|nr:SDR family oxidoreductase [Pseudorhodobacter sp.]